MSTLKADLYSRRSGIGPVQLTDHETAKSWFDYNHAGNTINNSANVSSIIDGGTGNLVANYSNPYFDRYYQAGKCAMSNNATNCVMPFYDTAASPINNTTFSDIRVEIQSSSTIDTNVLTFFGVGDLA